jgi:small-conductance mechanosensitive channel
MRPASFVIVASISVALLVGVAPALRAQRPVGDKEIVAYLNQTVTWYRDVGAAIQAPIASRDVSIADSLRRSTTEALRLAFDFARAQAAIPETAPGAMVGPPDPRARNLARAASAAGQRVADVQAELNDVSRRLQGAPAPDLPLLRAQRDELTSELNFAVARRDALRNMVGFFSVPGEEGLSTKLSDLERTVPEGARPPKGAAPAAVAGAPQIQDFHPESAGIVSLTTRIFSLSRAMSGFDRLLRETDALREANQAIRAPMRKAVQDVTAQEDAVASAADTADADVLAVQKQALDDLTARFKLLTGASAPLGEQMAQMAASRAQLVEWRHALEGDYQAALRYLLIRLGMLLAVIAVIFALSELWRRATLRYVQDMRRRRQVLLLRRVVVGCLVALFVVLSFVTEFGSLATVAGISAAGLAVALQSVLLSVVAYFFLVGRWGVRIGDRLTIGGVTGEVVDIGLFRLYLMELGGADFTRPTGRIVVFPNAVFFQPSAVFKQLPGVDYGWRTMTVTLGETADYAAVEERVRSVVEKIFAGYQDAVERQHKAALSSMNVHAPVPRPESRVRPVDGGLQVTIRYPVEFSRAEETEDSVTRAVVEEIDRDPRLRRADGSAPKIETKAG